LLNNYTLFFYKQLHFWVNPRVAKPLLQFEPQSCLSKLLIRSGRVAYYFIIAGESCYIFLPFFPYFGVMFRAML